MDAGRDSGRVEAIELRTGDSMSYQLIYTPELVNGRYEFPLYCNDKFYAQFSDPLRAYSNIEAFYITYLGDIEWKQPVVTDHQAAAKWLAQNTPQPVAMFGDD